MSKHARLKHIFALDYRSLALFRFILGIAVLLDIAMRFPYVEAHLSDQGIYPRSAAFAQESPEHYLAPIIYRSLHALSGSVDWQYALYAVGAAAAIMLALGYKTRMAAAASWFLLLSAYSRNPLVHDGIYSSSENAAVLCNLPACWALLLY